MIRESTQSKHNSCFLSLLTKAQFSSVTQWCPTLCDPTNHSTPGLSVHPPPWNSPKPMSVESVMPSNHLILCHPLLLLPSIFPVIRVFSNESALRIRWPKYWSFSFSISPSNEYSGLISFRMDWLDVLAVQGTLKSLLQQEMVTKGQPMVLEEFSPFFKMLVSSTVPFAGGNSSVQN